MQSQSMLSAELHSHVDIDSLVKLQLEKSYIQGYRVQFVVNNAAEMF